VPAEDSGALAAAIVHLLSNPAKARQMGAEGKRLVAEKFTTEAMMTQIINVYGSLLKG
jgi:glycosyltransferase involved in cell wall biosynthesis